MPRRVGRSHRRYSSQSDKEKRNNNALRAFHVLRSEDSAELSGIMLDLERDNSVPTLKSVPGVHVAYILDPHNTRTEFNSGYRTGFNLNSAKQRIESHGPKKPGEKPTIDAKIGNVTTLGTTSRNHKIIAANVESPTLVQERRAIYRILGDEGLKGFDNQKCNKAGAALIVLGTLQEPLRDETARQKLEEVIETSILVRQATELTFGPLQVA